MTPQEVIRLLSLLTLLSNIGIVLFFVALLLIKAGFLKKNLYRGLSFLSERALVISFIVALVATSGSLYLSEVAKFTPCLLCWYQRIFMYPLVVIMGVSIIKKTKDMWQYVLPLSIAGLVIALYHYYLQITPQPLTPCSVTGISVSCTDRQFTHFGYITIPWMSFSAFLLITIGMLQLKYVRK